MRPTGRRIVAALVALPLIVACGGEDDTAAPPAASSAPPAATAPSTTAPATAPAPVEVLPGRVAEGKAVFATSCDTCHAGLGTRKYIGPKLAGLGLSATTIRTTVVQGRSPMPAGLVQGQELADVVAFVRSIQ